MVQFTHKSVITWGVGIITLSLVILFLRAGSPESSNAPLPTTDQEAALLNVALQNGSSVGSPSPTKSMVTTMVTPTLSPLSPSLSPRLSPAISAVIKVLSPTPAPTPSTTATPTPSPLPTTGHVVINEIGWMGTDADPSDEWIELFNPGNTPVDMTSWRLVSQDGKPDIVLSGSIMAGEYYLIGRSVNQPISDIPSDLLVSFGGGVGAGLSNACESLELHDATGSPIDLVNCRVEGGWFAGTNTPKASMERINALITGSNASNWASNNGAIRTGKDAQGNAITGTPKSKNSVAQ